MRSIIKLTCANIRHGKGAFKSIILLMMLITFSFSGTVSNDDRLREARTERFSEACVPDLLVSIYDDLLTEEMLQSVRENAHVSNLRTSESIFYMHAPQIDGTEFEIRLTLDAYEKNLRVFNDDSSAFSADRSLSDGEIYLPYKLKLMKEFSKGTRITLRTSGGYDETFTVKGFYEDIYFGATTSGDNRCIVTKHDHERLMAKTEHLDAAERHAIRIARLYIDGTGDLSQAELRRELGKNTVLLNSSNSAVTRERRADSIELYSNVGTRIISVFVVLLLTVVLITMYNSICASIEMDQAELGILKSQGFTARQISLVYIIQYTLALGIGAVLGIAVSIPACRVLISMWKNLTGILSETGVSVLKCAALSAAIILLCTGFIMIATAKIAQISPVRAIAGAKSEVYFDSRLNTRIRKKPLAFFLALRQLNSHRKSYLGTGFIVMLLCFFIFSIMILTQGLDTDQLFTDITGEISITDTGSFRISDADAVQAAVSKIDAGAELLTESYHRMQLEHEQFAVHAYRSSEDVFKPLCGRAPKYDNEIMITEAMSKQLGKKIGDNVTVTYKNQKTEFIVTGYFQSVWEFGLVTAITPDAMKKLGNDEIEAAYIKLSDPSRLQAVTDMLNTQYKDKMHAAAFTENATITTYKKIVTILMKSLSCAIYAVLLTFAAVIVTMVCKRSFIRERTDIGIFKATGFTVGSLRLQFALRFSLIALIGSAAGCTAGILWSRRLIVYILRIIGLTDFTSDYSAAMFVVPSLILILCFFLTAWIASHRIRSVNVRELVTE